MRNIEHYNIGEGVNFTYIPDSKFKTTLISVAMFLPIIESDVSVNAVLPNLLVHSCKEYPSLIAITKRLEELYGASLSPSVQKIGDMQVIGIFAQGIDGKFTSHGGDNILELTKLVCNVIFEPNVKNEAFIKENIDLEKRQLKEEILAIMNDKKDFARKRCLEIMCKSEKFGIDTLGTLEGADKITGELAFNAWKNLLSSSRIEITMIGSGPCERVVGEFKKKFSGIRRQNVCEYSSEIKSAKSNVEEVVERKNVSQCKLVLGLRAKDAEQEINYPAMKIMNAILGGTPQSKLFVNVREKLSLCYYCSSRYIKQKAIMFIESGVEQKNIEQAKDQILEQLKDIRLGNFSDKDFNETKLYITQGLKKISDSLFSLNSWYLTQCIEKSQKSVDEHIDEVNSVTREQIIAAANQIELDTIYILSGEGSEQ